MERKSKRKAAAVAAEEEEAAKVEEVTEEVAEVKVKKSKRKAEETTEEVAAAAEPAVEEKRTKSKKAKVEAEEKPAEPGVDPELALSNFRLSADTVRLLEARGIKALFPIQARTFNPIYEGKDVVGQARTGSGKTLSFVLPIMEHIMANPRKGRGRGPVCIVLAPTRELAKQIEKEVETVSTGRPVSVACFYGGTSYETQNNQMNSGLDILVGTPGRIIDHMQNGRLKLSEVKYVILDECDRMLEMGFAENVDEILSSLYTDATKKPQTLLFSATMPRWVRETARKYLSEDKVSVDLVGNEQQKTSVTIQHLAIKCGWQERPTTIRDVLKVYSGAYGRSIIFTSTKREANELGMNTIQTESQALHGDIPQAQRERTLEKFREGKVKCLIATDVAARGLDIPEVDLVIQSEPPEKAEDYIHRSGRTGRAGKSGICICFYKPAQEYLLKNIEQRTGVVFKRVGPPQPADIVTASSRDALRALGEVPASVLPMFRASAEQLIADRDGDAAAALAAALAIISGHRQEIQQRSLLSSTVNFTTYIMSLDTEVRSASYVYAILERTFGPEFRTEVRGMRLTADKRAAVFDIPSKMDETVKSTWQDQRGASLEIATALPALEERSDGGSGGGYSSGGSGGGYGRGGYGGGGYGGGRGGYGGREGNHPRGYASRGVGRGGFGRGRGNHR